MLRRLLSVLVLVFYRPLTLAFSIRPSASLSTRMPRGGCRMVRSTARQRPSFRRMMATSGLALPMALCNSTAYTSSGGRLGNSQRSRPRKCFASGRPAMGPCDQCRWLLSVARRARTLTTFATGTYSAPDGLAEDGEGTCGSVSTGRGTRTDRCVAVLTSGLQCLGSSDGIPSFNAMSRSWPIATGPSGLAATHCSCAGREGRERFSDFQDWPGTQEWVESWHWQRLPRGRCW